MKINKIECDRCKKQQDFPRDFESVPEDWFELFQKGVTWHLCLECAQRALENPHATSEGESEGEG